jgi:uncharacterized membrane protein
MVASSLALAVEILLWEAWLAPLRPHGSMLVLIALPVFFMTYAAWRQNNYALQICSMVVLLYLTEGVMRAINDSGLSMRLALLEIALVVVFFAADLAYLAPIKRTARASRHD